MTTALQKTWRDFENSVINDDAGDTQRREMKLAFFAGAKTLFLMLTNIPEDRSDDDQMKIMKMLNEELNAEGISMLEEMDNTETTPEKSAPENADYGYMPIDTQMTVPEFLGGISQRLVDNQADSMGFNVTGEDDKTGEAFVLAFSIEKQPMQAPDNVTRH